MTAPKGLTEEERRTHFREKSQRRRDAAKGLHGFRPVLAGFEIAQTSSKEDGVWVKQRPEHGDVFEKPEGHEVNGVSALVDPEGRIIAQWIKTREGAANERLLIDSIKGAFDEYQGRGAFVSEPEAANDNLMTVYNIADHHLGLLAWRPEGGEHYDLKIGERLLLDKMRTLVAASPAAHTAVVLNLGDFFHADNEQNRTAKSGNALDVDGRYAKVLRVGVKLIIACIEMALTKHKRVIVRMLGGNHDQHSSVALAVGVSLFFSNNPRVEFDDDPSKFFCHRFGKTLITATHGDMLKPNRMPGFVASRWPELWGATKHRYAYFGHVHHSSKGGEEDGLIWETFQTLAAKDAWHAGEGYQSGRSMTAITHHNETGEYMRNRVSV